SMNVGDVRLALAYGAPDGSGSVPVEDPEPYLAAIEYSLVTTDAAVLKAVPDPVTHDERGNSVSREDPQPQLMVATEQLCPGDPRSPEYAESNDDRLAAYNTDPRCSHSYFMATYSPSYGAHLWVGETNDLALILGRAPSMEARA